MSRMMSRRAILRAIGISPIALSVAGTSRTARAEVTGAFVVEQYWRPEFDAHLARVVAEGKVKYRAHFGSDWDEASEKPLYRSLAKSLYTFYMAGIALKGEEAGVPDLTAPPDFLWTAAFNCLPTNSGQKVVENLRSFAQDDGTWVDRTRLCAFRCGWLAADTEITQKPGSKLVSCDSYKVAWEAVRTSVTAWFDKLENKGTVGILKSGGAC